MGSPPPFPDALIAGGILALLVVVWAHRNRWLTADGAVAALLVGTATFSGGVPLTAAMLFFFFSSGLLSRWLWPLVRRTPLVGEQMKPRGAFQVIATGMFPAMGAIAYAATHDSSFLYAGLSGLSFATADTWATHIGVTARAAPRILGVGRVIPAGLSGGMTLRGTLGGLAGAVAIGLTGAIASTSAHSIAVIAGAGFGMCLLDSVLGATVQTRRRCVSCGEMTEEPAHCNRPAVRTRGRISNSAVNLVCSGLAAFAGMWAVS